MYKQRWLSVLYVVLVLTALGAAGGARAELLAARVNGVEIPMTRLDKGFDAYLRERRIEVAAIRDPDNYKTMKRQVLDTLVDQELLWQEARKQGFVAAPEAVDRAEAEIRQAFPSSRAFRKRLEQGGLTEQGFRADLARQLSVRAWIRDVIARSIEVSAAEIHDYYVTNRFRFQQPDRVRVRHVLIAVPLSADQDAIAAARNRGEGVLAEAKAGADFAALARKYSDGPSASKGGDLGFQARDNLVKPFADAAFALQPGGISEVVRTSFGFHVIKLEERRQGQLLPEAAAEEAIRKHLTEAKLQQALEERLANLREQGQVEILTPL